MTEASMTESAAQQPQSDLVRRLREPLWGDGVNPEEDAYDPVRLEAAACIEALEAAAAREAVLERALNAAGKLQGAYWADPDTDEEFDLHKLLTESAAAQPSREAALVRALRSIANNTCCEKCQEAALVAREALAAYDTPTKDERRQSDMNAPEPNNEFGWD